MLGRVAASSVGVGFQTLKVNPLRTILSTLGVIMGVASLVAVLALGDGMERFAREQIARTTSLQAVAVVPRAGRTVDGVFVPDGSVPALTDAEARAVARISSPSRSRSRASAASSVARSASRARSP